MKPYNFGRNNNSPMYDVPKKCYYKKILFFLPMLLIPILSGCSLEEVVLKRLGIMSEEEYQSYIELRNSGQLDQEGNYVASELDEVQQFTPPENSIHVTFAKNAYLDVQYYLDSDLIKPVDIEHCYLMPGDCIYYDPQALICTYPNNSLYGFERFCIYSYNSNGKREDELFWNSNEGDRLVLQIPENSINTEISVMPIGKYKKYFLELSDYYMDAGQAQELAGTWIVDGQEVTEQTVEVSPLNPLTIDLKYDPEKYCFVSSKPNSFYHEKGLVRFETIYALDDNVECYSVELRPIQGVLLFDPDSYPVEHGSITFKYRGKTITEKTYITDGDAIEYIATPDIGYKHPQNMGQIFVNADNPSETNDRIKEALRFYRDKMIDIILPRPVGGTIEYIADGKTIDGNKCTLRSGTEITMNFKNWNGWICNAMDGEKYTVNDEIPEQTVKIDKTDIYSVFTEADSHKPTLEIVLTDSVKDTKFSVSASGKELEKDLRYQDGKKLNVIPDWLGQNDRMIFNDKVGTDQSIVLTMTSDTIFQGQALKMAIKTEDADGNKRDFIRYITKIPVEEKIDVYDENDSDSSIVYKEIRIIMSKVDISTYAQKMLDHAIVTLTLNDMAEPYTLKDGDVLETSREVSISIIPEIDYYVKGSKSDDGIYYDTMKYSKWEKEHEKILENHSTQKIWYVTLDASDPYGNCTYKLDNKVVSDRTPIHEGQKLVLEYTITDPEYEIKREGFGGFLGGLFHGESMTVGIPVSEKLDGKTIQRSEYIGVKQKEE